MELSDTVRLLSRAHVEALLDMPTCITAVEDALRRSASGPAVPGGVLAIHTAPNGFHVKVCMLELARPYFVTKVNANFPSNPERFGLPTIQGVLVLFDATCGKPLAIMDSLAITILRTAAASAVSARHLARHDATSLTIVGCGEQARAHLTAIASVRSLRQVYLFDIDAAKAKRCAEEWQRAFEFPVSAAGNLMTATQASAMVVTCTSALSGFLGSRHIAPGTFVAAVGADNPHKQELEPGLLKRSTLVVDDLDQCAAFGDLHHAIADGSCTRDDVRATLGQVVAGHAPGRLNDQEIIVFDSTGVAIEDVAAAAVAYERAVSANVGSEMRLNA